MVNKPDAILEIEKLLKTQINDFDIGKDDAITCITLETIKFTVKSIDIIASKLGKLEQLFIFDSELDDASFIDNLPYLRELAISGSKLKTFRVLEMNKNLYSLNLSNNLLQDISFLKYYKNINILDLSYNQIIDISILANFKSFTYLTLNNNDIFDISALKNIEIIELWIGQNKVYDLSPLYNTLKKNKIEFLNAHENPLVYPPMIIVERGENVILSWFELIITEVNKKITENLKSKNTTLDLGNLGITDLSLFTELFNLKHLKELIISNEWAEFDNDNNRWKRIESNNKVLLKNNISEIPKEISKLINLEKIIIGGDWKSKHDRVYHNWRIADISNLLPLKKLKFINISNNHVENIQDIIHLQNIEIIHLNNNRIATVPELRSLKNLKEIYLSNNLIADIQFLIHSIQIETVDLHSNNIENLLPLKDLLQHSNIKIKNSSWEKNCISVSKNSPNINPPYEILNLTKDDFFLYLKQLEYESKLNLEPYYNREIKVVLVGNSHAGKSTFLNYLKTKRFKKGLSSTHWLVTEELRDIKIENQRFKLRFFDFGGQDYYHDTHKMFFSSDCLYLLLWDNESNVLDKITISRNNLNEDIQVFPLEYWLDSIKIFAKKSLSDSQKQMEQLLDERDRKINSKVRDKNKGNLIKDFYESNESVNKIFDNKNILVIQNKIDVRKDFLNQTKLIEKYPSIHDFVDISISKDKGLKQFYELYVSLLKKNLNYNRPLLATWGYIKDNLNDIFKEDIFIVEIDYFKNRINNYLSVWLKMELNKSENEISSILFNDEEIVLFANFLKEIGLVMFDSENEKLKNTVIVNQNKFLKEVSKILMLAKNNFGHIEENNAKDIKFLKENIEILISHNIIFKNLNEKNYIAPLFLAEEPSFLVNLLVDVKTPYRRFKFDGFIPKSIILSVFSNLSDKEGLSQEDYYVWKNGLIFKDKNTNQKVLLKFDIGKKLGFAYIDVFNFEINDSESFIIKVVNKIKDILENECSACNEMVTVDGENFLSLKLIHENEENKNEVFLNQQDLKYYRLYDFKKYLKNKNNTMKKVFLSYSRQNLNYKESLKTHLSILEKYGLLKTWSCDQIVAGTWNQQIQKELEESDIIIYMVSANFMSSNYIMEDEVKKGIELVKKNPDKKIICVLVGVCQWTNWSALEEVYNQSKDSQGSFSTSDLSQFQFLPYHQYKNEQGVAIREEIVALEKWGRHPYDVINEAYNQIVSRVFNEVTD